MSIMASSADMANQSATAGIGAGNYDGEFDTCDTVPTGQKMLDFERNQEMAW